MYDESLRGHRVPQTQGRRHHGELFGPVYPNVGGEVDSGGASAASAGPRRLDAPSGRAFFSVVRIAHVASAALMARKAANSQNPPVSAARACCAYKAGKSTA